MRTRTVIALLLALTLSATATPARAATTVRYAGDNRYETAAQTSFRTFQEDVLVVYIATGESYADALSAGAAAAVGNGPVLLTPSNALPEEVTRELQRLAPAAVKVLGGKSVISDEVFTQIEEAVTTADVSRIAGSDRYATSAEVAEVAFDPGVHVYIAGGEGFADALGAVPAAGADDAPILLVQRDAIPESIATQLDRLDAASITIVGGTGAVSSAVESQLAAYTNGPVRRIAGNDRYLTAVAVSAATFTSTRSTVFLASGNTFADALGGGAAAAQLDIPVLLTQRTCIPAAVQAEIDRLQAENIVVLGGTGTIAEGAETTQC